MRETQSPPRSLVQRIMLSFALLVTFIATIYATALHQSMEFTESHLIAGVLEDEVARVTHHLDVGERPILSSETSIYGAPPLKPIPKHFQNLKPGFSELTDEGDYFVYTATWKNQPFVLVRDQEGFEDTERLFKKIIFISVLIVFFIGLLAGWWLSRNIMQPVRALSSAVREASLAPVYRPLSVTISVLIVFFIGLLAGWWLSRNIMQPVRALSSAVREASLAPVYRPLSVTVTNDEVGELAHICDTALRRLHDALEREKAFTGDVSHELRTPLTVIETSVELLSLTPLTAQQQALRRLHDALEREKAFTGDVSHELRTPLTVIETSVELLSLTPLTAQQQQQVDRIARSANDMRELVQLFLSFARLSQRHGAAEPDTVQGILQTAIETWMPFANEKGLNLVYVREAPCLGTYSPVMLGTIANNLLKNAVSYTTQGTITVKETAQGFIVTDTGPGLKSDEVQRIFGHGIRGSAGADDRLGTGLGLSIVSRICHRMDWQIDVLPSETGAAFLVTVSQGTAERFDRRHD